jgi:hypothetical protein
MADAPAQQQFDWSKDSGECVEGLKFDLGVPYTFILDNFTKHDLVRKDNTRVLYKKGDREGQPVLMYTAAFKEEQTGVIFKSDFFVQDTYRVNENAPETEDDFVRFSRRLGYNPILGGQFSPKDFITIGMRISAKLKAQDLTDDQKKAGKKAYNEIDVDSITLEEGGATGGGQDSLPEQVSDEVVKQLQALINQAPKAKKFADLAAKINKAGAKDKAMFDLLAPAMQANQEGKLKF